MFSITVFAGVGGTPCLLAIPLLAFWLGPFVPAGGVARGENPENTLWHVVHESGQDYLLRAFCPDIWGYKVGYILDYMALNVSSSMRKMH